MKTKPMTLKETTFFMWFFIGASVLLAVILTYETGEFNMFGYTVWEREEPPTQDYQNGYEWGRAELIMEIYQSPNELQQAVENGEIDYEILPPMMKQLLDASMENEN